MRYSRPSDFERFVLKEDADSVDIDTSEACRLAALSMVRQAARSVEIVSRHLDPKMYDNAEFCDAVSQLVVGSRRARVRVLVRDTEPVIKNGHRLVPLAQRLPAYPWALQFLLQQLFLQHLCPTRPPCRVRERLLPAAKGRI